MHPIRRAVPGSCGKSRRFCSLFLGVIVSLTALTPIRTGASNPPGLPATEQVVVLNDTSGNRHDLAIDPTNPQVIYWAIVGIGVLKSTDGGVSWVPKNYGLPGLNTYRLAIHPNDPNHLLVGFDGLTVAQGAWPYRSLDGAERWEPTFVCEREDGLVNLQTLHLPAKLKFDPTATNRLYYLMDTQTDACGGFYRSCDQGASYDRNPSCIPNPVPRPACAAGEPEPVNSIGANDADILEVDSRNGDLFGATGTHPEQSALQTSHNKGGEWFYDDVVDTRGYNFIPAPEQDPLGLYARTMVLAPSDSDARYAAIPGGITACNDHLAHPVLCVDRRAPGPTNPRLVVRWFGEMSGATDCSGNNLCDGDAAPDRVWRPIFNGQNRPSALDVRTILVHSTDANRVFVAGDGGPNEVLMLTPGAPGTEWNQTTLYSDSTHYFDRLVQDPGNPDSFYLLGHSSGVPVRGVRIQRFRSTDNWQTWNRVDLAEYTDYFHVNDIAETRGSRGHRIAAATTNDLRVADELGAVWSGSGLYSMHHAALAVAPSNPDRTFFKGTWAVHIGVQGFDATAEMDTVLQRRLRICTNVFNDMVVDPASDSILYAATGAGIYKHPQATAPDQSCGIYCKGDQWQTLARQSDGLADEFVWSLAFDPSDPTGNTMLAGTRSGVIYRSTDRGDNWSATATSFPPGLTVRDVKDIAFQGPRAYAASGAGLLRRGAPADPWTVPMTGDRIARIAVGATGSRRAYAAGEQAIYRSLDTGLTWQSFPVTPQGPYSVVMETTSRDGRHHLWVPDFRRGLYRISTTMAAQPGSSTQAVVLSWSHSPGQPVPSGYELHYGTDPDLLGGTGAQEGSSPILLGSVTSATLTGLNFGAGPIYVALKAIDGSGQRGPLGLPLTLDFGYLFSPRVTAVNANTCPASVHLSWTTVPQATGFKLYRRVASSLQAFQLLQSFGVGTTAFDDSSVTDAQTYEYTMTATFAAAPSESSGGNIASVTALLNPDQGDVDHDGIRNPCDNCPTAANQNQADGDGDRKGDICDNCPATYNPNQADADGDGRGDVCDNCPNNSNPTQADSDGDSHADACDNCPALYNPNQEDVDGDGVGNGCDGCPLAYNPMQEDPDGDGRQDACDVCPGLYNPGQADADQDGIGDLCDNCLTVPNLDQSNEDTDSLGDACDNCDLISNPGQENSDTDAWGDACDNCPGITNPTQANADGDAWGDACDTCPFLYETTLSLDREHDGFGDSCDNCPNTYNPTQADVDHDGRGDACDNCPNDYNPAQNYVGNPVVQAIWPNGGESLIINSAVNLRWSATDTCGGVSSVDILLYRNGTSGSFATLFSQIPNTGSRTWNVTGPATTNAFIKVVARDPANNTGNDFSNAAFTIKKGK